MPTVEERLAELEFFESWMLRKVFDGDKRSEYEAERSDAAGQTRKSKRKKSSGKKRRRRSSRTRRRAR